MNYVEIIYATDIIDYVNNFSETVCKEDLDLLLKKCIELSIDPHKVVITHCDFNEFDNQYPFIIIYSVSNLNAAKNILQDNLYTNFPRKLFGSFFGNLSSGNKLLLMEKMFFSDILQHCNWTAYNKQHIVYKEKLSTEFVNFIEGNTPRLFIDNVCVFKEPYEVDVFSYTKDTKFIYDANHMDHFIFGDSTINVLVDTCASNSNARYTTLKVFKPIKYKKPFITTFGKDSLKFLKKLGFKTFSDFWDESYDNFCPSTNQFDIITNTLVEIINTKTIQEITQETAATVEYNYQLLNDTDWNAWFDKQILTKYNNIKFYGS